jgi:multiple sugar transport system substrate-binding protein
MSKKMYSILGIALIVILFMTSCNPATSTTTEAVPTNPPEEKVVLSLYTNYFGSDTKAPVLQTILDDFMAANPNIEVKPEYITDTDMATKVETAFLANQETDLILQNWMGPSTEWLSNGVVVAVNQYLDDWGLKDKFKPSALNDFKEPNSDEISAFPLEGFNWPMYCNMEILEASGAVCPTTYDELLDTAKKVRAAGYQPFTIGGLDWTGSALFHAGFAAAIDDATAKELWSKGGFSENADARAFVEAFLNLRKEGAFIDNVEGLDGNSMWVPFSEGKAAMTHAGSWSYSSVPAELVAKVKLAGLPLPPNAKGATKPYWYSSYQAKGLWITRNGATKLDAVEKFTKFFYQDKYMTMFVEASSLVPPFKEVSVDETKLSPLFVQSLDLDVDYIIPYPNKYAPANLFDAWDRVATMAYVPGMTADEILKAIDDLYK